MRIDLAGSSFLLISLIKLIQLRLDISFQSGWIQTFRIGYNVLSQFVTDAKYHPHTPKPISKVIVVSQVGFDDGARQRKFEIETAEGIEVSLVTPEDMLKLEPN